MTLQEKELLTRFLQQLATAEAGPKDPDADALIRATVARQPEAAYLLVQRALQLEQLLQASQEQVKKLQADVGKAGSTGGGFLGDPNAWGTRRAIEQQQQPVDRQMPAQGAMRAAPGSSWSSGLFGNIASTAAGVVAGSFLFQGIQGLMNRGDAHPALASSSAPSENVLDQPSSDQPELLNSYNTPEAEAEGTFMADLDDPNDFA